MVSAIEAGSFGATILARPVNLGLQPVGAIAAVPGDYFARYAAAGAHDVNSPTAVHVRYESNLLPVR